MMHNLSPNFLSTPRTKIRTGLFAMASLALLCWALTAPVQATEITYELTYAAGQGTYDYTVYNNSLGQTLDDFLVYFPDVYSASGPEPYNLAPAASQPLGWTVSTAQPSAPNLNGYAEGFGATSGTGIPIGGSQAGFGIDFTYSGSGTPGSQYFEIYDLNNLGVPIDSGWTTPAGHGVPEGGTSLGYAVLAAIFLGAFRLLDSSRSRKGAV